MSISDAQFAKATVLDILVPAESDSAIEATLRTIVPVDEVNDDTLISHIPQRSVLFFDESLFFYVAIRAPFHDEALLKAHIARLSVVVEAHAISSNATNANFGHSGPAMTGNQQRDVIWAGKVDVSEEPLMVMEEREDEEHSQTVLLIWKLSAFLRTPRIRLPSPIILFKLSAALQPPTADPLGLTDPYLPNGIPFASNVLEPLCDDPIFKGHPPHLSASRVTKIPLSEHFMRPESYPLHALAQRTFRVIPALNSRIKYHKAHQPTSKPKIVASIEVDIPAFVPHQVELREIVLRLDDGIVEDLCQRHSLQFPQKCHPRDSIVWLYSLTSNNDRTLSARSLEISTEATVLVSSSCRPRISQKWKTTVDFTAQSTTSVNTLQRPRTVERPGSAVSTASIAAQSTNTSNETTIEVFRDAASAEGLILTINAEGQPYVGEPFTWSIMIVNRSSKHRHLALSMISKRKGLTSKQHHHSHQFSTSSVSNPSKIGAIADPTIDENVLYAEMKTHGLEMTQLICLSADVKVRPLNPGAATTTELVFLPLVPGLLQMEAIRVTDLVSNTTADVRDLPDVLALERSPLN